MDYQKEQKSLDDRVADGSLNSTKNKWRMRRAGVSADSTLIEGAIHAPAPGPPKPEETRAMLRAAIDRCLLFQTMTDAQRDSVIAVMMQARIPPSIHPTPPFCCRRRRRRHVTSPHVTSRGRKRIPRHVPRRHATTPQVDCRKGDVIIQQGGDGGGSADNFYVVGEGTFDIHRREAETAPTPPPPPTP